MPDQRRLFLLGGVSLSVVIGDQLTKHLVQSALSLGESQGVIGDLVRLTYIRNPNGLFGLSWGRPGLIFFLSLPAMVAIILFYLVVPGKGIFLTRLSLSLILGGALGNLIDRFRFGAVVDFIDVGIRNTRWPVFNVADSAVTIGVILVVLQGLRSGARVKEDHTEST